MGTGLTFAEKHNKTGNLAICCFGDGAVHEEHCTETFNVAMTWKLR
jgi:pyruvate dehydrogenase E1 component alpha subunit